MADKGISSALQVTGSRAGVVGDSSNGAVVDAIDVFAWQGGARLDLQREGCGDRPSI